MKMQELRQRVARALASKQGDQLVMDQGYEVQLEMRGIRIGTVSTLKKILDWIDEIVAEGNQARTNSAAT